MGRGVSSGRVGIGRRLQISLPANRGATRSRSPSRLCLRGLESGRRWPGPSDEDGFRPCCLPSRVWATSSTRRVFCNVPDLAGGRRAVAVLVVGRRGDPGASSVSWAQIDSTPHRRPSPSPLPATESIAARSTSWPVEFGRDESRSTPHARVDALELGVSRFSRFSSADSSLVVAGHLPASTAACRHHCRTVQGVPEQLRDLGHSRPLRLMIGPDLTDHPDRTLTQLGRLHQTQGDSDPVAASSFAKRPRSPRSAP